MERGIAPRRAGGFDQAVDPRQGWRLCAQCGDEGVEGMPLCLDDDAGGAIGNRAGEAEALCATIHMGAKTHTLHQAPDLQPPPLNRRQLCQAVCPGGHHSGTRPGHIGGTLDPA